MTEERHIIRVDAEGNASEELEKIADSSTKASKESDKLTKSSKRQGDEMTKLADALGIAQLGYAAVIGALVATVKAMVDATRQYAAQAASLGRLNRAIRKTGGGYEDLQEASRLTRQASNDLGIGLLDTQAAMQQLVEGSGDATLAAKDFQLALDISAASGEELISVTKDLAEARKGEFEGLKKYAGFNKEFVEGLTSQANAGEAAADAFGRLEKSYKGATTGLKGLDEQFKSFEQRAENVETSLGGILSNMTLLAQGTGGGAGGGIGSFLTAGISLEAYEKGFEELNQITEAAVKAMRSGDSASQLQLADLRKRVLSGDTPLNVAIQELKQIADAAEARQTQPAGGGGEEPFMGPAPLSEDEARKARIAATKRRQEEKEAQRERAKAAAEERKRQEELAEVEAKKLEARKAEGEELRIQLEYEAEVLNIQNQQLSAQREAIALENAEIDRKEKLRDLEKERQEQFAGGVVEQQLSYYDELKAKQAQAESQEKALHEQEKKRAAFMDELAQKRIAANQENVNALMSGAKGAADVADIFIENERASAAIRGAIAAAEATAAFASGNIPGGIGFTAAAAQFFAIAGGAGQTPTPTGGAGGGSRNGRSFEERAGTQRAGQVGGQPTNTTVQYVFNAGFAPSPKDARRVADEVERARRNGSAGEVR